MTALAGCVTVGASAGWLATAARAVRTVREGPPRAAVAAVGSMVAASGRAYAVVAAAVAPAVGLARLLRPALGPVWQRHMVVVTTPATVAVEQAVVGVVVAAVGTGLRVLSRSEQTGHRPSGQMDS